MYPKNRNPGLAVGDGRERIQQVPRRAGQAVVSTLLKWHGATASRAPARRLAGQESYYLGAIRLVASASTSR
jgi:hypothetical protein